MNFTLDYTITEEEQKELAKAGHTKEKDCLIDDSEDGYHHSDYDDDYTGVKEISFSEEPFIEIPEHIYNALVVSSDYEGYED